MLHFMLILCLLLVKYIKNRSGCLMWVDKSKQITKICLYYLKSKIICRQKFDEQWKMGLLYGVIYCISWNGSRSNIWSQVSPPAYKTSDQISRISLQFQLTVHTVAESYQKRSKTKKLSTKKLSCRQFI